MEGSENGENDACASAWFSLDAAGQIPVREELSATKRLALALFVAARPFQSILIRERLSVAVLKRGRDGWDRKGWERNDKEGEGGEARKALGFISATNVLDAQIVLH